MDEHESVPEGELPSIGEADSAHEETPRHLKRVSRLKHAILEKYLPPWGRILGSSHQRLCYFDCYAGPGIYESDGAPVPGSPIIAIEAATNYVAQAAGRQMTLILVEKAEKERASLEAELAKRCPFHPGIQVHLLAEDATEFIPELLQQVPTLAPTFFMVDPYGHPLTIPILNDILRRPQAEALINFMFYRINMDVSNPKVQHHVDTMFGDRAWRTQDFMSATSGQRETGFLGYFLSRIDARYKLRFRIRFDPEDGVSGDRTKYYLIHASNHPRAVLLMKDVMWALGDEDGTFEYGAEERGILFSRSPSLDGLRAVLLREYAGRDVGFDRLREETWDLPYSEKQYREVLRQLERERLVSIRPVTSKTARGLGGKDLVSFAAPNVGGTG